VILNRALKHNKTVAKNGFAVARVLFSILTIVFICPHSAISADITLLDFLSTRLREKPIVIEADHKKKTLTFEEVCPIAIDPVARRVFSEYGSVFAANDSVAIPWRCVFDREEDILAFQKTLKTKSIQVDGVAIDLQEAAMNALAKAAAEAAAEGLRIIPSDGAIAGRRSFNHTVELWCSRFFPALDYWTRIGKISEDEAYNARRLKLHDQVEKVMEWESAGMYFGSGRTRSIFSSTAPPGTSQHLSLLALDVRNYSDSRVRAILAENGWFQTVIGDPAHFTYLGVDESGLPMRGLMKVERGPSSFWVPRL
jgi:hypothetical protein